MTVQNVFCSIGLMLVFMGNRLALGQDLPMGQDTFYFFNYAGATFDHPVFNADGSRLQGTNFVAMLYGGQTMDMLRPATLELGQTLAPVPFTYAPMGMAGYFRAAAPVEIPGTPPCTFAWLQVRAWDARLGSSYEQ